MNRRTSRFIVTAALLGMLILVAIVTLSGIR
jgi:hypothetical protein